MIRYVKHTDIDFAKWDACVDDAANGLLYVQSFFLNNLCQWDALVLNNYEAVMPLPFRKKFSIPYIFTPGYAAQTGVFGNHLTAEIIHKFISAVPQQFKFIQLNANEGNEIATFANCNVVQRSNFVLDLQAPYQILENNFTKDCRKNIRQAKKNNLVLTQYIPIETVFTFYQQTYGEHIKKGSQQDFVNFKQVCEVAVAQKKGFTVGVANHEGELVSASFWGIDKRRLYYLLGAPTANGKKLGATYFLINAIIEQYAGSGLSLDFEGSDIESVAAFYKQFAPQEKKYPLITINRLPFYLKWLK
jgi:hypothetical protein